MSKRPGFFSKIKKAVTLKRALAVGAGVAALAIPGVGAAVVGGIGSAARGVARGALATGRLATSAAHAVTPGKNGDAAPLVDAADRVASRATQTLSSVADARDAIRSDAQRVAGAAAPLYGPPMDEQPLQSGFNFGGMPSWALLAAAGLAVVLLMRKR